MIPPADSYFLHPLKGLGYQFYSGIGSSISEWGALGTAVALYLRKHNCHHHGCPFIGWHQHPASGHVVCRLHHPQHHGALSRVFRRLGLNHGGSRRSHRVDERFALPSEAWKDSSTSDSPRSS